MAPELTDAEQVLLRYVLDDSIRDARQAQSIYGTDQRDQIDQLKALRAKLCGT